MIPFLLIGGGIYLIFGGLGNNRPSIDPADYGLPTKGFRGYRKGAAHFAKGGIYGTGKTSKKEILSAIKQYKDTIKDKEELKEELKSKDISDFEIDLIENKKLPELVERENVLHTQISFLLKKYGMENDYKPFEMNKGLYSFMKEQGFKDGGEIKSKLEKLTNQEKEFLKNRLFKSEPILRKFMSTEEIKLSNSLVKKGLMEKGISDEGRMSSGSVMYYLDFTPKEAEVIEKFLTI